MIAKKHNVIYYISIVSLLFLLSSCSTIGRFFSAPSYSHHIIYDIKLNNKIDNNTYKVFLKKSDDIYGIYDKVISEVNNGFTSNGIQVVDKQENADYIIGFKILSIDTDVDGSVSKSIRNEFLHSQIISDYAFDKQNSPYIFSSNIDGKLSKNYTTTKTSFYRKSMPALYTSIGATSGFLLGYFLFPAYPVVIGFVGAVLLGSLSYSIYSSFKDIGIVIVYEISVSERKNKNTPMFYKRKMVIRTSENSSDESYFEYKDSYDLFLSKQAVIGIGSKILKNDMINEMCPVISNSILSIFNLSLNK